VTTGKTIEELQKELKTINFRAIAGETLILWVHEIDSDAGTTQLSMFKIEMPNTKDTIVSIIATTLTEPLHNGSPDDVFAFYQLLAAFCDQGDGDFRSVIREYRFALRMSLIDAFEKNNVIGILPLLRIEKYLPYATSIRSGKENGKIQAGLHQLVWTKQKTMHTYNETQR
jgi:hypothetical protein